MRLSQLLMTQADGGSNDLLAHAGYTHRLADGLYTLLPLGIRVLQKITAIVRREMTNAGAQEVQMPLLQPQELWERRIGDGETRAAAFGKQLFRLVGDTPGRLVLAPTHEEAAAILAAACIRDSRDLPRVVYQIQPRFRDQNCPEGAGLLHTREFVMADAYGFHADRASLDESYAAIKHAFATVLSRCGVSTEVVRADTGVMGGDYSEEFVASLPNAGNDAAVRCDRCGYAASIEIAEFSRAQFKDEAPLPIEEVEAAVNTPPARPLIWVPFIAGGRVILAVITGNLYLNADKIINTLARARLDTTNFHRASAKELSELGATYDWISLVRTPSSVIVIADESVQSGANFLIPSARTGRFLINVNHGRDFRVDRFADLGVAREGVTCAQCGDAMRAIRGVEAGHIFKLGTRYTEAFGAHSKGLGGRLTSLQMGCYGLGITRLMATIAEQGRDSRGIVWPEPVAPFGAVVMAEQLYHELIASGFDVLLDDSDGPSEEKLRRADLLGIPLKLVVSGDVVDVHERRSAEIQRAHMTQVKDLLQARA